MAEKLRWGVLGAAKIAREKVIPALQKSQRNVVTTIASRDAARARETAAALGVPHAVGSYEELLASPHVDAVYNPLPNHLHVAWSIRALEAGKHILCEKPLGLSTSDAQSLADASLRFPRLKAMEAFMYRHHPQWRLALELVRKGEIGNLRTIHSFFSYTGLAPNNVRNVADWGGGALMDIGCYCISLARFLYDDEPQRVCGMVARDLETKVVRDPQTHVDWLTSGMLEFADGTATFTCSMRTNPYQRVQVFGDAGRIEIEIPFNAPSDRPCRLWHERDGQIVERQFPVCDQYAIQGDLFAQAVQENGPVPTPLADAVANMRVIDAVFQSAAANAWVAIN